MRPIAIVWITAFICMSACAQHVETSQAVLSPRVWPTARVAAMDAPPEILAVDLSPAHVTLGTWWRGRIVTTSNVASLEIRWPFFTFVAQREGIGQFAFQFHVIDVPTIYRRPYTVEIVARNTSGASTQRNVIVDFR